MSKRIILLKIVTFIALSILLPAAVSAAVVNSQQTVQRKTNLPASQPTQQAQPLPTITVNEPVSGAQVLPGSSQIISWHYTGNPGQHVKITLYRNNQGIQVITPSAPMGAGGQGSFTWNVPENIFQMEGNTYSVEIASVENPGVKDQSSGFGIRGKIQLLKPSAGDEWARGSSKEIRWTFAGNPGETVNIKLLRNGSQVLALSGAEPIGSNGSGTYNWTIPTDLETGGNYSIKVSAVGQSFINSISPSFTIKPFAVMTQSGQTVSDASALDAEKGNSHFTQSGHIVSAMDVEKETSVGHTASQAGNFSATGEISITEPAGNPLWVPGSTHSIKWTHSGVIGQHVKISLYRGSQFDRELVTSMLIGEGEGTLSWAIPSDIIQAENYNIQVQSVEIPARKATSAAFRIHGTINVTEPDTDEEWTPGTTQIVRWTHTGHPGQNVKVILLENGSPSDTIISSTAIGDGSSGMAAWDIPNNKSQTSTYAVKVQSLENPFVTDTSGNFKLKGKIVLNSPIVGQNINNGSTLTVQGEAYGCSSVKIAFGYPTYTGGGAGFAFQEIVSFSVPVTNKQFTKSIPLSGLTPGAIHAVIVSAEADSTITATAGGLQAH